MTTTVLLLVVLSLAATLGRAQIVCQLQRDYGCFTDSGTNRTCAMALNMNNAVSGRSWMILDRGSRIADRGSIIMAAVTARPISRWLLPFGCLRSVAVAGPLCPGSSNVRFPVVLSLSVCLAAVDQTRLPLWRCAASAEGRGCVSGQWLCL